MNQYLHIFTVNELMVHLESVVFFNWPIFFTHLEPIHWNCDARLLKASNPWTHGPSATIPSPPATASLRRPGGSSYVAAPAVCQVLKRILQMICVCVCVSKPIVPYLGGWTSIYQLFWCWLGVPRFWPMAICWPYLDLADEVSKLLQHFDP